MEIQNKSRAKAHKLLAKQRNNDPVIRTESYNHDMIVSLNHYNVEHDNKTKKAWVISYYPATKFSGDIPDHAFKTLGALVRISDNGYELSEKHQIVMDNEFKRLARWKREVVVVEDAKPVASIQDKMDAKVSEFLSEFNGLVDDYTTHGEIPKVDALVTSMGIRGPMVKKVMDRVQGTINELHIALSGSDKYLNEAYSNFKKTELKKLVAIYDSLASVLGQAKVMTVRKTRTFKAKPAAVVAKNVHYQKENVDLGLKSLPASAVVGKTEVWMYNTKYRKLAYVQAIDGQTLTFKGQGMLNFNVDKTVWKTVKKPDTLKAMDGKRMLNRFYKEATAKESKYNARMTDQFIILAVF